MNATTTKNGTAPATIPLPVAARRARPSSIAVVTSGLRGKPPCRCGSDGPAVFGTPGAGPPSTGPASGSSPRGVALDPAAGVGTVPLWMNADFHRALMCHTAASGLRCFCDRSLLL